VSGDYLLAIAQSFIFSLGRS